MKIHADDPRITAFALGEMDEDERADMERDLQQCPESLQLVEQIQAMAGLLKEELRQEPDTGLSEAQRQAVKQRLEARKQPKQRPWILRPVGASIALAATLVVVIGGGLLLIIQSSPMSPYAYSVLGDPVSSSWFSSSGGEARPSTPPPRISEEPLEISGLRPGHHTVEIKKPGYYAYQVNGIPRRGAGQEINGKRSEGRSLDGEAYNSIQENPFRRVAQAPLSTFSIDVDTASYANVRRFLSHNTLPPRHAVRIEEMINYFSYNYPAPAGKHPFSVDVEIAPAPWQPGHGLVRIGLKGKQVLKQQRPASNLVFLIDVSGSMSDLNKLPLLRRGMKLLVDQLTEEDRVAMVVYAGASGLVLPSTACTQQNQPKILSALERLQAGGSTNGGAGIKLAYDVAVANFIKGGTNRVLLATDGDFNVGIQDRGALVELIKQRAQSGVFLSVLGFGTGNLKDATLEQLADKGNGNYAYIDTFNEARKVLVEQMAGTLITIAKDVKIQVEFNPARVRAYRLIGYENRRLAARDFNDDKKDAGEIGAGHTVTALYEVIPHGVKFPAAGVEPLKYQRPVQLKGAASAELLTVKLRYKEPDARRSELLSKAASDQGVDIGQASEDFRFAAAVAWFGMTLRRSKHAGQAPHEAIVRLGRAGLGQDKLGRRAEFIKLVRSAAKLVERK